jgi:hypothetical protein
MFISCITGAFDLWRNTCSICTTDALACMECAQCNRPCCAIDVCSIMLCSGDSFIHASPVQRMFSQCLCDTDPSQRYTTASCTRCTYYISRHYSVTAHQELTQTSMPMPMPVAWSNGASEASQLFHGAHALHQFLRIPAHVQPYTKQQQHVHTHDQTHR